jgi:hypothetical protein
MTASWNFTGSSVSRRSSQSGFVLVVVLLILIGVSLISVAAVNTSVMELRMARNVEFNVNNFQTAVSAVDFVISDPSNLPTVGPLKVPVDVPLTDSMFAEKTGESVTAAAARTEECSLPPRMRAANSMMAYSAFTYEISASIDKNQSGVGQAGIAQGYLRMGPKC